METFAVTLTQEFVVPVLANSEEEAEQKATQLLSCADSVFDTDTEDYTTKKIVPIIKESFATEEAEHNEKVYKDNCD